MLSCHNSSRARDLEQETVRRYCPEVRVASCDGRIVLPCNGTVFCARQGYRSTKPLCILPYEPLVGMAHVAVGGPPVNDNVIVKSNGVAYIR